MEAMYNTAPHACPTCSGQLVISQLRCLSCGTEVAGTFSLSRLAQVGEPHASLIELFLRSRGNMKEMERELGLSYPTVRARLEEALTAAGFDREGRSAEDLAERRAEILDRLERGDIGAAEAATQLRELKRR